MPQYEVLGSDTLRSRRSIADALALLVTKMSFSKGDLCDLRVGGMRMPSGAVVGIPIVTAKPAGHDGHYCVGLPAAQKVTARRPGDPRSMIMDIFDLHDAKVEYDGALTLTSGQMIKAVDIVPALGPEPTHLDRRILHSAIVLGGAEKRCYRQVRDELPEHEQKMIPEDWIALNWSELLQLVSPSLKAIKAQYTVTFPTERVPSLEKISQALQTFGVRTHRTRNRARRRLCPN